MMLARFSGGIACLHLTFQGLETLVQLGSILSMLLTSFTVLNILSDLSVFLPHPLKEIKYHEELGRNIKYLYFLSKLYLLLKLMIRCAEPEIKY